MLVRRETPADAATTRDVICAAFARPGESGRNTDQQQPPEVALVDNLRVDGAWIPALSLVATTGGGEIIGHVLCTRGNVGGIPALALAPLSVRPDCWRRGVGQALVHAVLGAADALDEPLVAVLGVPGYYGRFGFRPGEELGIMPPLPQWSPHFQVRTLTEFSHSLRGPFSYSEPFGKL